MDLDTNVKEFKYSTFNKILCVILCLVTFIGASGLGILSAMSIADTPYDSESMNENDWTNRMSFYRTFRNDANSISSDLTYSLDVNDITKKLLKNKQKYIDEAYKEVLALRAQAEQEAQNNSEYYDETDYDGYEEVTTQNDATETTTQIYYDEYTACYDVYVDKNINIGTLYIDGTSTKESISKQFDENYKGWAQNSVWNYDHGSSFYTSEMNCYARLGELTRTNLDDKFNEKDVYNSDYYLVIKNGKLKYQGISKLVCEDIYTSLTASSEYAKDGEYYFYINQADLNRDDLVSFFRNAPCNYSQIYAFNELATAVRYHIVRYIACAVVLLVISFICGFRYFTITGKRREDEKARLVFYDYIPFELSLGIAVGIGIGAFVFGASLYDNSYGTVLGLNKIILYLYLAFAVIVWGLSFIVTASTFRYAKSDKKFYKHLLIYWIFVAFWQGARLVFKGLKWFWRKAVVNTFRKLKNSARRTFSVLSYKPNKFKRNVILIALLWLFVNIMLIGIGIFCAVVGAGPLTVLSVIAFLVGNILVLRRICEYVKNLDVIIDASSRHEEPVVDFDSLDESLKILVEGMRYTNIELQNAVNKAVKDERLRTELITNVSHDLKTPLTSIITYVDLLSKCDINDEKAQEYIKVLDEKGAKLKRLIEDLIEASKVTSGNVTVNLTTINLSELCLQSTVDAQLDFEKAGLDLIVKDCEKPPIVTADGAKAFRIIENLLSNARKYSAKSSRVYVDVYSKDGYGIFEIKNISAEPLDISPDDLTERFVRGDKSRGQQEGNGLGLSIAKELAILQNGKLELSIDGDLFKARVMLPIAK